MKKYLAAFAIIIAGCATGPAHFSGQYLRANASPFEAEQGMTTGATITENPASQGGYVVTLKNSYGDRLLNAKAEGDRLKTDDNLVIEKQGSTLKIYNSDIPEVQFMFREAS